MAAVFPFRAIRYNAQVVGGLERVLTQPYDKITPAMQKEYLARSPYNLTHIVKGEGKKDDSPTNNVYTRAAQLFRKWQEQGILTSSSTPALYAYAIEFPMPESPAAPFQVRRGFIGLGQLEDYDSGVIFRHEETLTAPKADRLELLRATRAHFEQIFMLYSDPQNRIEALLAEETTTPPVAQVRDDYGAVHRLWEIARRESIQAIQQHMLDKKLVIADGHHRYETALTYRRECQAARPHRGLSDCSFLVMTFVSMNSEGLVILPTHRLVSGIPGFSREDFLARAGQYFHVREYPFRGSGQRQGATERLRADMSSAAQASRVAIAALFAGYDGFDLLQLRQEIELERLLPGLSSAQRSLDVTILHRIAFALCLGMDEAAVREERFLTYIRDFQEGVEAVAQQQAQACFFLHPVRIEQVREIAFQGQVLPQKSTDFYPKLLSGLAIYKVEG